MRSASAAGLALGVGYNVMKRLAYIITFLVSTSCLESPTLDIPKHEIDLRYYHRYKAISEQIGLDENPHETTLRFWQEGSFDRFWMTQLTFDSARTIKSDFTIFDTWIDSTGKLLEYPILDSVKMRCNLIQSKKTVDRLMEAGYDSIKSQNDYPDFQDNVADGWTYSIEVFRNGTHKFITYHCPATYSDKSNQAFLALLDVLHPYAERQEKCGK
jgi:hypothetical protein